MHYPKPADQASFEWTPPLPFPDLGQRIYVYQNLLNAGRTQTKRCRNKLIEMGNLWIKLCVGFIKRKSRFSRAHLDDKFITFGIASCILVPVPILRNAIFCEITCWNHISNYHTVLNPYNLACWQLTPLHYMDVLSWIPIFHLVFNENDFSVPFERHT